MPENDHTVALALARGQVPPGVDPESKAGQHYARILAAARADVAKAAPMTDATKNLVVVLLRGGQRDAATG